MNKGDKIFKSDPIYMKNLIGKTVQIKTVNNKVYIGVVYVIDPIFKTVVLHTNWKSEDEYENVVILHHAIDSLEELPEPVKESYLEEKTMPFFEGLHSKTSVKKWLKHMMIDVKESGDYLKIDDHIVIMPPYGPDNCICNNTIILEKIQKILRTIPQDYS